MELIDQPIFGAPVKAAALTDHTVIDNASWAALLQRNERFRVVSVQIDTAFNQGAGFDILLRYTFEDVEEINAVLTRNADGHVTAFGRDDTGETLWTLPEPIPAGATRYLTAVPVKNVAPFFGPITDEPMGDLLNGW